MRTREEIIEKLRDLKNAPVTVDFFGVKGADLLTFIPFSDAVEFLKKDHGISEADWAGEGCPADLTREGILKLIEDYMPFAWNKANDCRGLSAARSLDHFEVWMWLLGGEHWTYWIQVIASHHTHYGKPHLVRICEHFGWDWKQWDDGSWRNNEFDEGVPPEKVLG